MARRRLRIFRCSECDWTHPFQGASLRLLLQHNDETRLIGTAVRWIGTKSENMWFVGCEFDQRLGQPFVDMLGDPAYGNFGSRSAKPCP